MKTIGRLTSDQVPSFVELAVQCSNDAERLERVAKYRTMIAADEATLRNIIVASIDERVVAAMRLRPLGKETCTLSAVPVVDGISLSQGEYASMIECLLDVARGRHYRTVEIRLTQEESTDDFEQALGATGFRRKIERVEYRTMLEGLPSEEGTPLVWRSMSEVGLAFAAEMLLRCCVGDPYSQEEEDPVVEINDWLSDPMLISTEECVQIGYANDEPIAFICAQVQPSNGWSSIRYMGVLPEARRRGLGRWVHRHGFSMMRQQGGAYYHGGTAAKNEAMRALFRDHGCQEFRQLTEWTWNSLN